MQEIENYPMVRLRKIRQTSLKSDPSNFIYLSSAKPTIIGRVIADDVNTRMLSKSTPLMISRRHATVTFENGKVFVVDHSSLNGVYIRNKRIRSGVKAEVKIGDRVAFGCGIDKGSPPEFEYYVENAQSKHKTANPNLSASPLKRKRFFEPPSITIIESNTAQIKEQEQKIKSLSESLQEKEKQHKNMLSQFEETQSDLLKQLENSKLQLENERQEAELHLKGLLENQLNEQESALKSQFDMQIRDLELEKTLVETNLQQELSKKLSEKDEAYQKELEKQKLELETTIYAKESEKSNLLSELRAKEQVIEKYQSVEENQKQLEQCLQELRDEISEKENQLEQQKEITKKVEIDAKQSAMLCMEDEFSCIICSHYFIEATTLPCAHTFCSFCLWEWLKKKKNCPVCRRKMKGKAVRSLVLDSCVEKLVETFSDAEKEARVTEQMKRETIIKKDESSEGNLSPKVEEVEGDLIPLPTANNRPGNREIIQID